MQEMFRSYGRRGWQLAGVIFANSITLLVVINISKSKSVLLFMLIYTSYACRWLRLGILSSSLRWWVSLKNILKGMHSICTISLLPMTGNNCPPQNGIPIFRFTNQMFSPISVSFEFQHNVCGRSIYAEGSVDAAMFLHRKVY